MRITGPIKTPAEYEAALAEIDRFMDAAEGSPEADRLELLSILVEAYENQNYPIDPPHPIEAIKFRMDQAGMARRELEPYIGSRARVGEILNRVRPLSLMMIRRLNTGLGIPLDSLIQPYPLKKKDKKNATIPKRDIKPKTKRSVRPRA
ncbi:MAG TPA: transcriptional regulator [Candidatus Binataceae bacterium]